MSEIYSEFRDLALELISEFGAAATVFTPAITGLKDALGRPIAAAPRVDVDGFATSTIDYKDSEIDGSIIKATDCYVFFHSETKPKIGMFHECNGVTYAIVNIMFIESREGIVSLCKLQLRR